MSAAELRLPQLAEGMEYGRVAAWLKQEGDRVSAGEPVAEIETDKTNVELEAPASGVLRQIQVAAGSDARVGALLAVIADAAGEAADPRDEPARAAPAHDSSAAAGPRTSDARAAGAASHAPAGEGDGRGVVESPAVSANATPLAASMARAAGIELAGLAAGGTRITKAVVERALGRAAASRVPAAAADAIDSPGRPTAMREVQGPAGRFTDQPLTAMRRVTAARLQAAKQTIPHFYLTVECAVSELMRLRAEVNARNQAALTVTDFLVFAASRALRRVPQANASWADTAIRLHESVDIAVAVNTTQGLITPVLRGCERKTLGTISAELKALAAKARDGRLKPEEYSGGTFTISNLGMFGISAIVPIVNPPQSAILGVGAIEQRPCAAGSQVVVAPVMSCTLAADHRVLDGAAAAELLRAFRELIEQPAALALHA